MWGMGIMKFSRRRKMVMSLSYLNQSLQNAMTSRKKSRGKKGKKKVGLFKWGESGDSAHLVQVMLPKYCNSMMEKPKKV